jgi:hypothetical protein
VYSPTKPVVGQNKYTKDGCKVEKSLHGRKPSFTYLCICVQAKEITALVHFSTTDSFQFLLFVNAFLAVVHFVCVLATNPQLAKILFPPLFSLSCI